MSEYLSDNLPMIDRKRGAGVLIGEGDGVRLRLDVNEREGSRDNSNGELGEHCARVGEGCFRNRQCVSECV